MPRVGAEQIPSVPFEIHEHGNAPVWLVAWRRDDLDASGSKAFEGCVEVVDAEEHADAAGELLAGGALLLRTVSAGEQNAGPRAGGPDDDPTLRPAIVGLRGRVLDQLELENVDEKPDRRVVIPNDEREKLEMRHGESAYRAGGGG